MHGFGEIPKDAPASDRTLLERRILEYAYKYDEWPKVFILTHKPPPKDPFYGRELVGWHHHPNMKCWIRIGKA